MWTLSGFADEIDADLATQCAVLTELGLTHLELRSAWGVNVLDLDDAQVDRAAAVLQDHGLAVSSIGSPIGKIQVDDPFDPHLVRMDRALDVAERLGAPYIRIFSFFLRPEHSPDAVRDEVVRRMAALADRARERDVVLLHENEKAIFGDVPERVLDLVTAVDSPALRLAWDPANFVQVGVDPFPEAYAMLRPYVDYIQIKDALHGSGKVVVAGEGDGRIPATVRALREDGYDGFFSMEPHLAEAHHLGGFSGPDGFRRATRAFMAILDAEGVTYR
ncbi:sugar phosphate isomerase/epimerase [Actinotalea sp. Marseille-Q4924]|uniref:sugar phosphate isomerase/epimerase family protein n=1 Tax=Actinotalea sp. Marseille-Q4924 TaxID=2866571 RepID=UPI001CE3BE73|nr:sugar phosphate isomerase/epimerase family protein [Actinotalea sp. Marseille-Q4924]